VIKRREKKKKKKKETFLNVDFILLHVRNLKLQKNLYIGCKFNVYLPM